MTAMQIPADAIMDAAFDLALRYGVDALENRFRGFDVKALGGDVRIIPVDGEPEAGTDVYVFGVSGIVLASARVQGASAKLIADLADGLYQENRS